VEAERGIRVRGLESSPESIFPRANTARPIPRCSEDRRSVCGNRPRALRTDNRSSIRCLGQKSAAIVFPGLAAPGADIEKQGARLGRLVENSVAPHPPVPFARQCGGGTAKDVPVHRRSGLNKQVDIPILVRHGGGLILERPGNRARIVLVHIERVIGHSGLVQDRTNALANELVTHIDPNSGQKSDAQGAGRSGQVRRMGPEDFRTAVL
jgi:hypothetical protein